MIRVLWYIVVPNLVEHPALYVYIGGVYLKRCWCEEFENVAVFVSIGVTDDGYREIIGAVEGLKEDLEKLLCMAKIPRINGR